MTPAERNRLAELAQELVEAATHRTYDHASDEVLTECLMCGKAEEHAPDCPVPIIELWLAQPRNTT